MRSIHREDYITTVMSPAGMKCRPVRETHQPLVIANFVVDTPIPSISSNSTVELRSLPVEFLDRLNSELERRFAVKDYDHLGSLWMLLIHLQIASSTPKYHVQSLSIVWKFLLHRRVLVDNHLKKNILHLLLNAECSVRQSKRVYPTMLQ